MPRDEDDDGSLPPLGSDTQKFLEQAKKGQPRNFLLVCKGNKVNYLTVRKKPIKKNEISEARKAGYKGDGYFGVINGKGMELVFNLAQADGYTAEPVKDKILKDFMEEKADFKCKPTIAIVATLPEIPFDEDDLKNPLVIRFHELNERIPQAVEKNPDEASALKEASSSIRDLLLEADSGAAERELNALESRIQAILGGTQTSTVSSTAPNANAADTFKERLAALLPKIKAVAGTPEGDRAKLLAGEAVVFARNQDFGQANGLLDQLEKLLQGVVGSSTSTSAAPNDDTVIQLRARLATLVPIVKAFTEKLDPASETKKAILTLLRDANASIEKDNDLATQLLNQIDEAVSSSREEIATTDEEPAIDWAQAKTIWQDASDLVDSQITKLQSVLRSSDDSELKEIAEFGLNAVTGNHKVRLMAAIQDIERSAGDARSKAAQKALGIVKQFRSHLYSNVVEAVDSNPFGVVVTVESTFSDAFDSMEKALSSM